MEPVTLESLARRVDALERLMRAGVRPPSRDWRTVVGTFENTEFARAVDAAALAIRDQDRQSTRDGDEP